MPNPEESIEEKKEEQNSDVSDEDSQKYTMTSAEEQTAKHDIHAWRKRRSYTYQRNSLLSRRISQGELLGT